MIDTSHPSYFDHAYDHVPGPFIVEGFRQSAVGRGGAGRGSCPRVAAVLGCTTTFGSFGEFGALLECSAEVTGAAGGRVTVAVELHQYGKRLASAGIELGPYPA
ncbi:hypothetical protein GCM10020220_069830 [Nonomuraea rubra]|uniref:AfsA-related hotdog domain-containing protein n=1 Tax=Nonomuraea rubra TaxID=46180 RepID=UPI0031F0AC32